MSIKNKKQNKMLWTIVLTAAYVGLFFMLSGVEAKAELTPVEYVSYNEGTGTFESLSCSDYVTVTTADSLEMTDGKWYVFDGTVEITDTCVSVSGSTNMILKNDCEFKAFKGIDVTSGSSLSIYGQTINGANVRPGKLIAIGENNGAGIGGSASENAGNIIVNGGEVTARGNDRGAGIGGGYNGAGGNITINGGIVTATGGSGSDGGAGIGGGGNGAGGNITINGGEVTATGGSGNHGGAGIGGGENGAGGNITINGGMVTAIGGSGSIDGGAGIGGGKGGAGGSITITGGKVTATGEVGGAGIGGGENGAGGSITINGGEVTATGEVGGAGIGGGRSGAGGSITINGGEVTATGEVGGAGIGGGLSGAGGNITITGGMIEATGGENSGEIGAGIGDGAYATYHGSYTLESGMKWFTSLSEASGYEEITGTGTFGANKRFSIVYKEHSGFMTASGKKITAKYITGGDKRSVEMVITDPFVVYGDADSAKAGLFNYPTFNYELGKTDNEEVSVDQVQYYDSNGRLLGEAPTDKGNYTAKITVDGVTAAVEYEITQDDPTITAPTANSLTYNGFDQELITGGSTSGGRLKYSLSMFGSFSADIPKKTTPGRYTVYYMVEGNNNYKSSRTYSVSSEIRKASLNLSLTQSGWVKGGQVPSPVLSGNASGGAVTYRYKKLTDDESAYSTGVPTEAGNYIIKAIVAETGNYFGATATAEFTISEPDSTSANPDPSTNKNPEPAVTTPVYNSEPVADKAGEVSEPSIFSRKNKDGSETKIEIVWNADRTTTVINENKQADGATVVKEETRDANGNGTLKIEKKDGKGSILGLTEGTIKVNKKGTETIESTTQNANGSVSEKTQKTYKRDPNADNIKKVTISEKKTDAAGNTETIKTTALVGVLGDAIITEKSTYKGVGADGKPAVTVKEERQYSLSVNGRLKLLSLTTDGEKVTFPENVELDGMTRVVKAIGKNAMKGNKTVKEVVLGENITTICTGAFKNCKNLELIELTGSIKKIYKNAFKGIAENAKFVIAASEEDFERIVELLKKSGVSATVTFERV